MALRFQAPGFVQPKDYSEIPKSIDDIFNAYQARKQEAIAAEERNRANALQDATQTAQFGAPLNSFTTQQMQAAAGSDPLAASGVGPLNNRAMDKLGRLREGLLKLGGRDPQTVAAQAQKAEAGRLDLAKTQAEIDKLNSEAKRGPADAQPKQNEFLARNFGDMATQAEGSLTKILAGGYDPSAVMSTRGEWVPNAIKSGPTQQYEQAARQFVQAVLRRESGATITPDEMSSNMAKYFPMRGDSPETIAQKTAARALAIRGLAAEGARVPSNVQAGSDVQTRKLKDGTEVRVRKNAQGQWEEV